jgi:Prohead core protein protease.
MKLITEHIDQQLEYITEATKGGEKNMFIEGIFMQAEAKNRNGRVYPKKVMEAAVKKYVDEQVSKGRAVGELNHPDGPTVNLDKVSHLITDLKWEGNNIIGKAKILNTPMGQIAKGLMEGGVQLGVSSRGMGSVIRNRDGVVTVGDDFVLNTVDIVQDPSAHEAFVNGIMEGAEWIYNEQLGIWTQQTVEAQAEFIKENYKKLDTDTSIRLFKNFLNSIDV